MRWSPRTHAAVSAVVGVADPTPTLTSWALLDLGQAEVMQPEEAILSGGHRIIRGHVTNPADCMHRSREHLPKTLVLAQSSLPLPPGLRL
jgi:hypothetical protein